MNILFLHRAFPGQFKYLAAVLASNPSNNVIFITNSDQGEINGIKKILYRLQGYTTYSNFYEEAVEHGKEVGKILSAMKNEGFKPDIIYGFAGWGSTMFVKDIFPDVPLISYFEWFGRTENSVADFGGQILSLEQKLKIQSDNEHVLISLKKCDMGVTPTQWQKQQFPEEFHNKIQVVHDGIDTATCAPDLNARFLIQDKNDVALAEARSLEIGHCEEGQGPDAAISPKELTANDEVVTYGTRGMEPYRGFIQFMAAAGELLKRRPNLHIVIAGDDYAFYSPKLEGQSYKDYALSQTELDMNRIHFVGMLPFHEYVKLLQVSSAHVYLTVPYVLSWSILNAMSVGCCVVASDTSPVQEVIKDNYNGLLFNFFNSNQLVGKIEYALENREKMQVIRTNARQTVLDNYALEKTLPQQVNLMNSLILK